MVAKGRQPDVFYVGINRGRADDRGIPYSRVSSCAGIPDGNGICTAAGGDILFSLPENKETNASGIDAGDKRIYGSDAGDRGVAGILKITLQESRMKS